MGTGALKAIDKVSDATRPAFDRMASGAHQAVDNVAPAARQAADTVGTKSGESEAREVAVHYFFCMKKMNVLFRSSEDKSA